MPRSWLSQNGVEVAAGVAAVTGLAVILWPRSAAPSVAVPATPTPLPATPRPPTVPTMPSPPAPVLTDFAAAVASMTAAQYERAVLDTALAGNVPTGIVAPSQFVPVTATAGGRTGTFFCASMPLCVGPDSAPFHAPVSVVTAQRIADHYGVSLPTRKMVDAIHASATARVPFRAYSADRQSPRTFVTSSAAIEARRAGRTGIVSDFSKDYLLTNMRRNTPDKCAIYGGWDASGARVQSLSTVHSRTYYDYSQQPRFVAGVVLVDGAQRSLAEALADPATAPLFSDEGTITGAMLRY